VAFDQFLSINQKQKAIIVALVKKLVQSSLLLLQVTKEKTLKIVANFVNSIKYLQP